jgi:hypothetical protein
MSKHTPGPWQVMDSFYPSIKEVFGASFKISCVMWATDLTEEDYQQRSADLRLIAAAPDLLEALQSAERAMSNKHFAAEVLAHDSVVREMIRAAIAKAGGAA